MSRDGRNGTIPLLENVLRSAPDVGLPDPGDDRINIGERIILEDLLPKGFRQDLEKHRVPRDRAYVTSVLEHLVLPIVES